MYYVSRGTVPHKRHTQHRAPDGALYAEELFGVEGFTGRSSLLYHVTPPTRVEAIDAAGRVEIEEADDGVHRHRLVATGAIEPRGDARAFSLDFDRDDLFVEPEGDAEFAQVIAKRLDDLVVGELENSRALVDERDGNIERGEDRRVFQADDACADDDQIARKLGQAGDAVGIDHTRAVEGNRGIVRRAGAAGDQDRIGIYDRRALRAGNLELVRIDEPGGAVHLGDVIAEELLADDVRFALDDRLDARDEVVHGDVVAQMVAAAVEGALGETAEIEDRLAKRLAGNGAGVNRNTAQHAAALDHGPS